MLIIAGVLTIAAVLTAVFVICFDDLKTAISNSDKNNEYNQTEITDYGFVTDNPYFEAETTGSYDNTDINGLTNTLHNESNSDIFSTQPKNTSTTKKQSVSNQKLNAKKFSELGISGFELKKIKFITTNYGFWCERKLIDDHDALHNISSYIQNFASDYGFDKTNIWKSSQTAFNDQLKAKNHKVSAAVSIDDFNKVLRDIYGPSAEQFSYSDFSTSSDPKYSYNVFYTKGSAKCPECLVFTEYNSNFESNYTSPNFTGFSIKGNLISALWVERNDFDDEPSVWMIQESYFAKGPDGYYLHSVNPEYYGGGEYSSASLEDLSDYEFYDRVSGKNRILDLSDYYPELTTKAQTQNTQKPSSVEDAYIEYIANRKNNGIDADFADTSDEGYSFYDLDGDGVEEMIILGMITTDPGWFYCRLYKCDPETNQVSPASDLIYYYSVVRFSPKHSSLVYCPYRGNSYYMSFMFTKYDGNYSEDWIELYHENAQDGSSIDSVHFCQTQETQSVDDPGYYTDDNIDIKTKPISDIKAK